MSDCFGECLHVNRIGLSVPPSDTAIRDYAKANDCVIVSHDTDFLDLLLAKGFPPKIILLKIGNIDTASTLNLLLQAKDAILEWYDGAAGILEITVRK